MEFSPALRLLGVSGPSADAHVQSLQIDESRDVRKSCSILLTLHQSQHKLRISAAFSRTGLIQARPTPLCCVRISALPAGLLLLLLQPYVTTLTPSGMADGSITEAFAGGT